LMQLSLAISYRLYIDPDGDVVSSFYHNHLKHLNFIRETNKRQLKQLHLYTVVSESQKPNILASATLLDSESVQEFFLHNIDDENLSTSPLFPPIAGQQQRKCLCEKVFSPNETHSINEMRVLNMPALKQRVWAIFGKKESPHHHRPINMIGFLRERVELHKGFWQYSIELLNKKGVRTACTRHRQIGAKGVLHLFTCLSAEHQQTRLLTIRQHNSRQWAYELGERHVPSALAWKVDFIKQQNIDQENMIMIQFALARIVQHIETMQVVHRIIE